METKEALSIILDLATQNALEIDGECDTLDDEALKQHTALNIIVQLDGDVEKKLVFLPNYEKDIHLPCYGITLHTWHGTNRLTSNLHRHDDEKEYTARIDGIESLILAHFSAGLDVRSNEYVEGIETTVEAIFNRV